jgi:hypothetical protein
VPRLRLKPVGEPPQYAGELVSRATVAGLVKVFELVAVLGPLLGGPDLLGDPVTRYLLLFADHCPAPLTGPR